MKVVFSAITKGDVESSFNVFEIKHIIGGSGILGSLINNAIMIGAGIDVVYLIYAAYHYIMSRGEKEDIDKAKQSVKYGMLGMVYLLLAYAITNTVSYIVTNV